MSDEPFVSIVIPVWQDEQPLARCLRHLTASSQVEVIVACALGEESRYRSIREIHPKLSWVLAPRGRGMQMNTGAAAASGRWLMFLHADCELPRDWPRVLVDADARNEIVAGAFRLTIDSRAWQARIIERAVRLRIALLGMPYGDQALFVRRRVFEMLGGYADLPLMEDIELVRRLKGVGRLVQSRSAVLASARKWERDGWFRRSGQNLYLAARFLSGEPPSRLAQTYFGRKERAIVMMARAPWSGGKTRLQAIAGATAHLDLRAALFLDTLDLAASVDGADHLVACEPAEACERLRDFAQRPVDVFAQRGADLGARLSHAFEDAFRLGFEHVIIIGSDLPDLPRQLLEDAARQLELHRDRVVLGPATDGGYYLVGLNRPAPAVFDGIDWGTERVFEQTISAAASAGLDMALLDTWADVDEPADLARLMRQPNEDSAPRTRAWISRHWPPGVTEAPASGSVGDVA